MKKKLRSSIRVPSATPLRVFHRSRGVTIPEPVLQECACNIYKKERIRLTQAASLVFCSDFIIRSLNRRYRKIDRATDVLSFSIGDPDLLGEIYISVARAAVQARRFGSPFDEEILRLFIHGLHHLLGYDHENRADREIMEEKERRRLAESIVFL
jgi:probable rRNA maturation factor